jgi:hypothetical protein
MMRKKWVSTLLFCVITLCCNAQTEGYKFYTQLDTVKTSGFYNIELTPAITAYLKTDYSDLRIVNDSGKWVPHRLRVPATERCVIAIEWDMKILKKTNTALTTEIIIQNNEAAIKELRLIVKNTSAERYCTLTGSDNLQNWFSINDSVLLRPNATDNKLESFFEINFPSSDYKYFKLLINNKDKEAINILRVRSSSSSNAKVARLPEYASFENPQVAIFQKDSANTSFLKLTQKEAYHFDKISIKLSSAKYFYRTVKMYLPIDANSSFTKPGTIHKSFIISNNSNLEFDVPLTNAKQFYLLVHNEDNLPLKVAECKTWNNMHLATAYLEKGNNYKLILGNESAVLPNYDLTKLNINIPDSTAVLPIGTISAFKETFITVKPPKNNNWILWAAIIGVLIVLLLFTKKMITEVNKRKQDDSL